MAPARDAARLAGGLALAISVGSGMWIGLAVPRTSAGSPSSIPPGQEKAQPTPAPTIVPSPGRSPTPGVSAATGAGGRTAMEAPRDGAAPIVRGQAPGDGLGERSILLAIVALVGAVVAALGALVVLSRRRRRGAEGTVGGEPVAVRSTGTLATKPEGGPAGPRDPLVTALERSRPGIAGPPGSTVPRPAWVTRLAAQAVDTRRAGSGVLVPPDRDPSGATGDPRLMTDRSLDGSPLTVDGRRRHPPPRRLG